VLYVSTTLFTSVMMSVGNDRNQRLMAIGLPLVFVVFVIQFAAGLLVYWIASNVTMIPQQYYMLRKYGRPSGVPITVESGGRGNGRVPPESTPRTPGDGPKTPRPAGPPQRRARKKRSGRRR
jgi:YidC/Oxa1 family membrane protein insertase